VSDATANSRLRVRSVKLRDFRGIDAIDLDLTGSDGAALDLAVFAGANGTGKTALLEAILMVLNVPDRLPNDSAPRRTQVRFGANQFAIETRLEYRLNDAVEVFDAGLRVNFKTEEGSNVRTQMLDGRTRAMPGGWYWQSDTPMRAAVEYFSSRREPEALGETPEVTGPPSHAEAHRVRELKRRLVSAYYRGLRSKLEGSPAQSSPFTRLQRFWRSFAGSDEVLDVIPVANDPGSGDEVVLRDAGTPIPQDVTSLVMARELSPSRSDVPRMVPLDRLSSGQVALFALAGPLVFRDAPADIVLIDEPEQHLHVQWQRQLLPALRDLSPSTQFLVATHSEEILDSALSYERFVLVEESDPRAQLNGKVADRA
jgi:energy-coupling factor transporter ATP-binding protein EcfA2